MAGIPDLWPGSHVRRSFDLLVAVRRRVMLTLMAGGLLAGCGSRSGTPVASSSSEAAATLEAVAPQEAVAADYAWFRQVADLRKGFCFTWVHKVRPSQVLERMDAKELERVGWQQLVGAGDGQRGAIEKYYFGVSRLTDDWSLVVEDNGELGLADDLLRPLSAGTTLVSVYRGENGRGRFLLMDDRSVQLDFDPAAYERRSGSRAAELGPMAEAAGFAGTKDPETLTAAAFALAERFTEVPLSLEFLQSRTYLFSTVPIGHRKSQ